MHPSASIAPAGQFWKSIFVCVLRALLLHLQIQSAPGTRLPSMKASRSAWSLSALASAIRGMASLEKNRQYRTS